jgi:hypothetical protein
LLLFDPARVYDAPLAHARLSAMAGRRARAVLALTALVLAANASACGIRLETRVQPTPTADAVTAARDLAARNEAAIVAALGSEVATGSGRAALQSIESLAAPAHLDVLGGVYEPFPSTSPAPPSPGTSASPTPPGDLRAAVAAARDDALDAAFTESETPEAFLSGSIGLTHAFALWHAGVVDARRAGVPVPVVAERTLPGSHGEGVALVPEASGLAPEALAELAVWHDKARFTYEVIAAREAGARRALALERASLHGDRSDALTSLAGSDSRTPVYELPNAKVTDEAARDATARETESAIGWRYMELTSGVSAADRAWLMSAAFDAYAAGATLPGFESSQFPVLPGVEPASY